MTTTIQNMQVKAGKEKISRKIYHERCQESGGIDVIKQKQAMQIICSGKKQKKKKTLITYKPFTLLRRTTQG